MGRYYTFRCSLPENILAFMPKVISLTLEYISLVLIELSIRIFEYVLIFNNVSSQTCALRHFERELLVIYIKMYFNNTNQQTIAFIDKHS